MVDGGTVVVVSLTGISSSISISSNECASSVSDTSSFIDVVVNIEDDKSMGV